MRVAAAGPDIDGPRRAAAAPLAGETIAAIPRTTQALLTAWLGLSLGSLVVAGVFAILVAFARTPAVELLGTRANLFHLALVSHVTFALTVWFIAFAGLLWVYVAWRSNYALPERASWAGWAIATAGAAAMAVPAFTASGTPYLNDYIPTIDHPLFWPGLLAAFAGVALEALAYLVAWHRGRRAGLDSVEGAAAAVAALAMVLAVSTLAVTWARLDDTQPFSLQLRALFWGAGHIFQFMHTTGMVAVWVITAGVALGVTLPERTGRTLVFAFLPFLIASALVYLVWSPEALLVNRVVTWVSFSGLGGPTLPLAVLLAGAMLRSGRARPWSSPLFSGTALCFALFAVGGLMGVIGFRQDTRVPAHYHGMVGAVTLAYMGLAPLLLELTGRRPWKRSLTRLQPYLYGIGLLGIMIGLHWAGGRGAPRKTIGFGWADAQALLAMNLMGLGSLLAIAGGLAFVLNIGIPLLRRAAGTGVDAPDRSPRATRRLVGAYIESLKLRIGMFIAMAAVLGYLATVPARPSASALAMLFVTTLAAAAGAGALNHFLDRDVDRLMPRTARRPLPSGRIGHAWHVVALGIGLVAASVAFAIWRLHPLVALHLFLGAFTYVVIYTVWLKRRSWLNVVVGGLAGSFAVLSGGSLARPELCLPPLLFALVLFFWSPSHFWSLGIAYRHEYAAARIPMLPAVRGAATTARSIVTNTVALVLSAALPVALGITGPLYLALVVPASAYLLLRHVRLLSAPEDRRVALHAFHAANVWLLALFFGVLGDALARIA
jgi:protoheme IX farnesyltransferase